MNGKSFCIADKYKNGKRLLLLDNNYIGVFYIPYAEFEEAILKFLRESDLSTSIHSNGADDMNNEINSIDLKLKHINKSISRIIKFSNIRKPSIKVIQRLSQLNDDIINLEEHLQDLEDVKRHKYGNGRKINDLIIHPTNVEDRYKLSETLKKLIDRIIIHSVIDENNIIAMIVFKGDKQNERAIALDLASRQYSAINSCNLSRPRFPWIVRQLHPAQLSLRQLIKAKLSNCELSAVDARRVAKCRLSRIARACTSGVLKWRPLKQCNPQGSPFRRIKVSDLRRWVDKGKPI